MNQRQLIERFCFDYSWSPKAGEMGHFEKFCGNIKSIDILRKTLDIRGHPKTETGRIFRPNVATLQSIAQEFINERAAEKRREAMSNVSPDEQCFYCNLGHVMGIQERVGLWSTYVAGRCECAQGDDAGYLAQRRPVKPTQEIQDYARDCEITCPEAAERMVYERSKDYREYRQRDFPSKAKVDDSKGKYDFSIFFKDQEERQPYDFGDGFEREVEDIPF